MSDIHDDAPLILTQPQTAARTIALTPDQLFALTDAAQAALDAGLLSEDLAYRLMLVSAELCERGPSRVLPFPRKPEAVS
jgi:hypothetical protein